MTIVVSATQMLEVDEYISSVAQLLEFEDNCC